MKKVCVIGAGVVGLSTAFRLKEVFGSDIEVSVIADKFFNETTTYGCGGLWEPYQIAGTPDSVINRYGKIAFDHFLALYYREDADASGVKLMTAYSLLTADQDATVPSWADIPFHFRVLTKEDLANMKVPSRYVTGFTFGTLVIDQKYYLRFMSAKLQQMNVRFIQRLVKDIPSLYADYDIIVNCAGLGAVELVNDSSMYPIRGQVLRVKAPWMQSIWFFGRSYIIPNNDNVVIGGTAQKGDWNTTVSNQDTNEIMEAVCELFPGIGTAPIVSLTIIKLTDIVANRLTAILGGDMGWPATGSHSLTIG
jgi:glycine/D-amino acid oxidase-like deaminating enzyme